ncbi:hypothetical protein [uncultured Dysosmobacter sp.]|nr:hypothetical protein [uncultured Dysosmobacter sp.]
MNEQNTIKELLDHLHNNRHMVEVIAAAYLGCKAEDVEITAKQNS